MASMLSPETEPDPEPFPEPAATWAATTGAVCTVMAEKTQASEMRVAAPRYGLIFIDDLRQMAQ